MDTPLAVLGDSSQKTAVVLAGDDGERASLLEALESGQFSVQTASNAAAALALIYTDPPSCLLADLAAIEREDPQFLRKIKNDNIYGHLPVLALVEQGRLDAGIDWFDFPVDDYVVKPYASSELLSRVNLALVRTQRDLGANPLTGLPGNLSIMREADKRIAQGQAFAMAYLDVDHFKAFNDAYGFSRGDEVLRMTARVLVNSIMASLEKDCAVGHIGGDDFVFLAPSHAVKGICETIIRDFDAIVPAFYDQDDRERGWIKSTDRQGNEERFPMLSISIAVVDTQILKSVHAGELSARAAQVKKYVKQMPGSTYMVDRRH